MCNNSNSVGECDHSPLVVPCEYEEAKSMNQSRSFWVTFHLLFQEDGQVYSFLNFSDYIFNAAMARECGVRCTLLSQRVLVSEDFMPWLYDQIIRYENVLDTIHGKERKRKYTFKKH